MFLILISMSIREWLAEQKNNELYDDEDSFYEDEDLEENDLANDNLENDFDIDE